ncbi:hypothetical protein B0H17DRAFT_1130139 [Mycena rosella]|uniref:Uncharacterized protein n=1 Tax=Mycena rosella TaxID=1033263 RepID=A0AAD7DSA1_MYCRO|nr:hypothetical protein B0H17DRAFT_1130139 [Mycena rosella]
MLECNAPGQNQICQLAEKLWRSDLTHGPDSTGGYSWDVPCLNSNPPKATRLRNDRVLGTAKLAAESEIHNLWVSTINSTLKRDKLLTNRTRFGDLAIRKQLVLNTWSGTLLDEDSLLDDWIKSKGVLVGIQPTTRKNGHFLRDTLPALLDKTN